MDKGRERIERGSSRALFSELLTAALAELGARPSPLAKSYLVELLEGWIRRPGPPGRFREGDPTLGEAFLEARRESGAGRMRKLRDLGDRALFVAGVFGDSLRRSLVDMDYVGQIGRAAYADVSTSLSRATREPTWPGLFGELARDFGCFVDVLAEVGDRTRAGADGEVDLLRIYERYAATASERDRRRLIRRGVLPLAPETLRRWQ